MKAPHLNRALVLEGAQRTPDGAGGFIEAWSSLGTLWAEVLPGSGSDVLGEERMLSAVPYLLSAVRMVEAGFATVEDVDKAVVGGLSHPMGPLRLSDLVGLDTLKLIADKMYEEFKEPLYGPPPLLLRMVEAGRLGKKSGQGFYTY